MKKTLLLSGILMFCGCEKDPASTDPNPELQGASWTNSAKWNGTYNIDTSILWELIFWEVGGNNAWRFGDGCANHCGGSSYTLDILAYPKTVDFNVNVGCVFEGFEGNMIKGIYEFETDTTNGVISNVGLTIAISNPGLERPSSFNDRNATVWTLDFIDDQAQGYQDTFEHDADVCYECDDCKCKSGVVKDCDGECGGSAEDCVDDGGDDDGNSSQFNPIGYKFYRTTLETFDSGCSGSSVTEPIESSIYWEFTADGGANSNSGLSMEGDYQWSMDDDTLNVTYYMFEGGNLWDYSFTMTSDSTMYYTKDEQCSDMGGFCIAWSNPELQACCEEEGYEWLGCEKTYYIGTSIDDGDDDDGDDDGACSWNNNDALFDPRGYKFYKTSETVYDSETECSGSSQTSDIEVHWMDTYYDFFPDGSMDSNSSLNWGPGGFEYCTFDSSLYVYWFVNSAEYGVTFTMTSDSTFYKVTEPNCTNPYADNPEDCIDATWQHCTIQNWSTD